MAISNLTYYVSVDSTNFKLKDAYGETTTSTTTSGQYLLKATESSLYNRYPMVSRPLYYQDSMLRLDLDLTHISQTQSDNNYVQAQGHGLTVGVSIPAEYTDSGLITIGEGHPSYGEISPSFKMTWNKTLESYVAESKSSVYNITNHSFTGDAVRLTVYDGTNSLQVLGFTVTNAEDSSNIVTSTIQDSFILINTRATTTGDLGYTFSSYGNDRATTYYSSSYNVTRKRVTVTETYNVDANGSYTSIGATHEDWSSNVLILDRRVTNNTSWLDVPDMTQYTQSTYTRAVYGVIADEEGNVEYGVIYGYGPALYMGERNEKLRPAVITSFSKWSDVSTVDTSWYGTFSSVTITSNSTRTLDRYAEFNNYGMGGVLSQGTYYLNTSSGTAYSESSRTSDVYLYYDSAWAYASITIPVANRITSVISDNSYPRQSETKSTVSRSELYDYGSYGTSVSITSSETLSEEITNTRTNFTTSFSVDFSITAGNYYLSITNDYTTSGIGSHTSYSTTFYEATVTSSCNVTSYSGDNGYSYYTTFYGELANRTFYATSWINSAVVSSSTNYYVNSLTLYTVGYTNKTFGNRVNSTTIHAESTIISKAYRTSSIDNVVSELSIESSTFKSVDIPLEYFTTQYTSWKKSTRYYTYIGPKISEEEDLDTYYDFSVTVTENGSYSGQDYIDSQESTSSSVNTTAYGGTTYRLSELISSNSGIIPGINNMTLSYAYDYDVKSMFSLNDFITTLSNFTIRLNTSYINSYDTSDEYNDYYVTKSTSLAARSTDERFIDRVEISRTFTSNYYVTYTVAMYNYSTIGTVSSSTSLDYTQSEQEISTVARTFISSTADLDVTTEIASSTTATSARGSFIYSSRELVSSITEQQNDTLIFASTFNTYSFYNSTYTTSTLNTVASTLSATTYEDWYNPVSWTSTALSVATSTSVVQTVNTTSGVVSVTQSVNYTPTYNDVDGIYVTTN